MILVSFFSEDNDLFDEMKICYICDYQSNENRAYRFFGTPGICGFYDTALRDGVTGMLCRGHTFA